MPPDAPLHHAVSLDDEHGVSAMRGASGMGRIHADFTLTSADGWGAFIRLSKSEYYSYLCQ